MAMHWSGYFVIASTWAGGMILCPTFWVMQLCKRQQKECTAGVEALARVAMCTIRWVRSSMDRFLASKKVSM